MDTPVHEIFVDTELGQDANDGTFGSPFKSLEPVAKSLKEHIVNKIILTSVSRSQTIDFVRVPTGFQGVIEIAPTIQSYFFKTKNLIEVEDDCEVAVIVNTLQCLSLENVATIGKNSKVTIILGDKSELSATTIVSADKTSAVNLTCAGKITGFTKITDSELDLLAISGELYTEIEYSSAFKVQQLDFNGKLVAPQLQLDISAQDTELRGTIEVNYLNISSVELQAVGALLQGTVGLKSKEGFLSEVVSRGYCKTNIPDIERCHFVGDIELFNGNQIEFESNTVFGNLTVGSKRSLVCGNTVVGVTTVASKTKATVMNNTLLNIEGKQPLVLEDKGALVNHNLYSDNYEIPEWDNYNDRFSSKTDPGYAKSKLSKLEQVEAKHMLGLVTRSDNVYEEHLCTPSVVAANPNIAARYIRQRCTRKH